MLLEDGGIIDDLIAYALPDRYLLVVNAGNVGACRDLRPHTSSIGGNGLAFPFDVRRGSFRHDLIPP